MDKTCSAAPLWTRDFTILTLGSVVSMLGSTLSSFAMDLMVPTNLLCLAAAVVFIGLRRRDVAKIYNVEV